MDDKNLTMDNDVVIHLSSSNQNDDVPDTRGAPTNASSFPKQHPAITSTQQLEPPTCKRRTIHRIVRTTTITNDDTVEAVVSEVSSLPPPPPPPPEEPTTEPPPVSETTDMIRLQVYGATTTSSPSSSSISSSSSSSNLECLLLETGWGCRRTTTDNNNNNNNIITFDCMKRVSYDTEHTYHVHVHALEDNYTLNMKNEDNCVDKKIHHRILCVPFMSELYNWLPGPILMNDEQQIHPDFWDDLQSRIRFGKAFVDSFHSIDTSLLPQNSIQPPTVSLVLLMQLAPSIPIPTLIRTTDDDILQIIVQSKNFHDRLSSLCQELNIHSKYYTPIVDDRSNTGSNTPQPSTTNGSNNGQNISMKWWWEPKYSIDYCFESIIQQIVKEENTVLSSAMTTSVSDEKQHPTSSIIEKSVDDNKGNDISKSTDDILSSVSDSIVDVTTTNVTTSAAVNSSSSSSSKSDQEEIKKKKSPPKRTRKTTPMTTAVRTSNMNHNHKRMRH